MIQLIKTVNIGIADRESVIYDDIKGILGSHKNRDYIIKWYVNSGNNLLQKITKRDIDLLIMDIRLYELDGIDIIQKIKDLHPELYLLVYTHYGQTRFVKAAFMDGADGYMMKTEKAENFINAVNTIMTGKVFMGKGISIGPKRNKRIFYHRNDTTSHDPFLLRHELTIREREILTEICTGKSDKEIAKELYISDQTVSVHKKNILRKFKVNSTKKLREITTELNLQYLAQA